MVGNATPLGCMQPWCIFMLFGIYRQTRFFPLISTFSIEYFCSSKLKKKQRPVINFALREF